MTVTSRSATGAAGAPLGLMGSTCDRGNVVTVSIAVLSESLTSAQQRLHSARRCGHQNV